MGYRVRVLGIRDEPVSIREIEAAIQASGVAAVAERDEGDAAAWEVIDIVHASDGPPIMQVERNPVIEGELGADELREFVEEVKLCKPSSGAAWLQSYLPRIKIIVAMQLLSGTDVLDGWSVVDKVRELIWQRVGGILQADLEGFTNEHGDYIIWQFSDEVSGRWPMAVRGLLGGWKAFEMELSNQEHRKAFLSGRVPKGIKSISR